MIVTKNRTDEKMTVSIDGRLDSLTVGKLEAELEGSLEGVESLTYDLEKCAYISSAGLRMLLTSQKIMNRQGEMTIINVNDEVMDIFEMTGFADILNIE